MLGGARLTQVTSCKLPRGRVIDPETLADLSLAFSTCRFPTWYLLDPGALGIFQCQLQLAGEGIHGRALPLPRTFTLGPQVTDPASPRRDHAADCPEVGAVGVVLVQTPDDV